MKLLAWCFAMTISSIAAAADPTPCSVLMEVDVSAVPGAQWKRNDVFSEGEVCAYTGAPTAVISMILTRDASMGAAAILAGRQKLAGDKAKLAAGPGGGAYRVNTPRAIAIVFGKGNWVGQIEATPAATKDLGVLDQLAKVAYERLP